MQLSQRLTVITPLAELWNDAGVVPASRGDPLNREQVRELLRSGPVCFVLAAVGQPLQWVPLVETHSFWKLEVGPHLVERPDQPFDIYSFPHGYTDVASLWFAHDPAMPDIVLLEKHH